MDRDLSALSHHLEMDCRPPSPVTVGNRQPGDGRRQLVAVGGEACGRLGGDLRDAVGAQERPDAVVVAELVVLFEDVMAHRLVDAGRRAVEEGPRPSVVLHQPGEAPAVGAEVALPVVRLGDGEVDHVVGVLGEPGHVAGDEVDRDAPDPGPLEAALRLRVREAGRADHLVGAGQRQRDRLRDLAGEAGDHHGLALEGCSRHGRGSFREWARRRRGAYDGERRARTSCGHRSPSWVILSFLPDSVAEPRSPWSPACWSGSSISRPDSTQEVTFP